VRRPREEEKPLSLFLFTSATPPPAAAALLSRAPTAGASSTSPERMAPASSRLRPTQRPSRSALDRSTRESSAATPPGASTLMVPPLFSLFPFSSSPPRSTEASPVSATFLARASDFANATGASSTGSKTGGGGDGECVVVVTDIFVVVASRDAFPFAPAAKDRSCGSSCCSCAAMGCRGPFILALCVVGGKFRSDREQKQKSEEWNADETCRRGKIKFFEKNTFLFLSFLLSLFLLSSRPFLSLSPWLSLSLSRQRAACLSLLLRLPLRPPLQ